MPKASSMSLHQAETVELLPRPNDLLRHVIGGDLAQLSQASFVGLAPGNERLKPLLDLRLELELQLLVKILGVAAHRRSGVRRPHPADLKSPGAAPIDVS